MRLFSLSLLLALTVNAQDRVQFNRDIRPLLSDKCFACHGPDDANRPSALRFDKQDGAFVELSSGGRAIVPGDAAASKLFERIASDDPVLRMPPAYKGHAKLSAREIELVRRWIEQGAEWQGHWAFLRVERPEPSTAGDSGWVRNPVDAFAARRLEREGLTPNPEADKTTLIRRVTLDLTGLPPTPQEVDDFLADDSSMAYERVVDRLLTSPRYGERMAFRWLEAARYADTNGYQNDMERDMWRWRDWVIQAFNSNKPFDKFTIEQLAGDLLDHPTRDQLIATGFNRNHRGNGEAGIVPEEYHVEYVADRVETTAMVWMGVTMGCTRCHDHKYDPFTQKEFYQLFAYFNNVPDRGRYFKYGNTPPTVIAPTAKQQAELEALDAKAAESRRALTGARQHIHSGQERWRKSLAADSPGADWSFTESLLLKEDFSGGVKEFDGVESLDLGNQANYSFYDRLTVAARIRPDQPTGAIVSRMGEKGDLEGGKGWGLYLLDGKIRFKISNGLDDGMEVESVEPLKLGEWSHVAVTYDGSRLTRGMKLYVDGEERELANILDHSNNETKVAKTVPLTIGHGPGEKGRFRGAMADIRLFERDLSGEEVAVTAVSDSPADLAAKATRTPAENRKLRWAYLAEAAPEPIRETWSRLRNFRIERQKLLDSFPTVMVMADMDPPRATHVLNRGSYDAPGAEVSPGVPAALTPLPAKAPNNRLGLAQWLVDRDNPLTARVIVNRYWQMLFGTGIVKTVEDFGSQGEWPTHPELLDWLAAEFMESGWDVKGILRTIVTSATYRQSSNVSAEKLERDPENRLLSRGPRVRLPAETIRDQALAVSGLLHEELGGPSVKPYQPAGLWTELSNWGAYQRDKGDGLYRRSLYTFWKRTIAPPTMLNFDAAPRETCVVRETRTNTPLQALDLMNNVTYVEASRVMAERMMREGGSTPGERLDFGFRLVTARRPAETEAEILLRSYRRFFDRFQTTPEDAKQYLGQGDNPPATDLEPAEYAAYAATAGLMLNLDEAISKE